MPPHVTADLLETRRLGCGPGQCVLKAYEPGPCPTHTPGSTRRSVQLPQSTKLWGSFPRLQVLPYLRSEMNREHKDTAGFPQVVPLPHFSATNTQKHMHSLASDCFLMEPNKLSVAFSDLRGNNSTQIEKQKIQQQKLVHQRLTEEAKRCESLSTPSSSAGIEDLFCSNPLHTCHGFPGLVKVRALQGGSRCS